MLRTRMMWSTILALCAASIAIDTGSAHALTRSYSGKTLALYSENPTLGTGPYSATILKGKKKNVLVIETTIASTGTSLCINSVTVNGMQAQPTTGAVNLVCTGVTTEYMSQAVSGVFFLDIDDAETASPGSFYNMPLNVVVSRASDGPGQSISIVVRMEKK